MLDAAALARELLAGYAAGQAIAVLPTARDPDFDVAAAYRVEAELARLRRAEGHEAVGRKVGFASRALWRALKLETLLWAHMYDDTVRYAANGVASLSLEGIRSPKIEPEIVFKLREPLGAGAHDPASVLEAIEWIALGFEIIDCPYPDWRFQPADFLASFGLHAALVVGEPQRVDAAAIPMLVEQLPRFTVKLLRNGAVVDEGSGKNCLRSPALCLAELAAAASRGPAAEPLASGELVSSGTLTESQPIARGETWTAVLDGIELPARLTLTIA